MCVVWARSLAMDTGLLLLAIEDFPPVLLSGAALFYWLECVVDWIRLLEVRRHESRDPGDGRVEQRSPQVEAGRLCVQPLRRPSRRPVQARSSPPTTLATPSPTLAIDKSRSDCVAAVPDGSSASNRT